MLHHDRKKILPKHLRRDLSFRDSWNIVTDRLSAHHGGFKGNELSMASFRAIEALTGTIYMDIRDLMTWTREDDLVSCMWIEPACASNHIAD